MTKLGQTWLEVESYYSHPEAKKSKSGFKIEGNVCTKVASGFSTQIAHTPFIPLKYK